MSNNECSVTVADIRTLINDLHIGVISLVGDHGGLSLVTGDVKESSLVPGTLAIETEHGTVHLEPEQHVTVHEDPVPVSTDPQGYQVDWEIDLDPDDANSPAEAAAFVWTQVFHRGLTQPAADEACVFTVNGTLIDLSDNQHADLFASEDRERLLDDYL